MNIGLIGLGNIGVHFGTRLLDAGHDLIVHDRSAPAQERLVAKGAKAAASAKELASRVEIVLLDHGLYRRLSDDVRCGTAVFWPGGPMVPIPRGVC